jgi:integrase
VVRALDDYLAGRTTGRTTGRIFVGRDGEGAYGYRLAYAQLGRLCRDAGLPAGVTPHSLSHSSATESLRLGAALQGVQDALGHANPRTTRKYDRSRHHLDRSPNYLLAAALTVVSEEPKGVPVSPPGCDKPAGGSYETTALPAWPVTPLAATASCRS